MPLGFGTPVACVAATAAAAARSVLDLPEVPGAGMPTVGSMFCLSSILALYVFNHTNKPWRRLYAARTASFWGPKPACETENATLSNGMLYNAIIRDEAERMQRRTRTGRGMGPGQGARRGRCPGEDTKLALAAMPCTNLNVTQPLHVSTRST